MFLIRSNRRIGSPKNKIPYSSVLTATQSNAGAGTRYSQLFIHFAQRCVAERFGSEISPSLNGTGFGYPCFVQIGTACLLRVWFQYPRFNHLTGSFR